MRTLLLGVQGQFRREIRTTPDRGRDAGCPAPPSQIPACGFSHPLFRVARFAPAQSRRSDTSNILKGGHRAVGWSSVTRHAACSVLIFRCDSICRWISRAPGNQPRPNRAGSAQKQRAESRISPWNSHQLAPFAGLLSGSRIAVTTINPLIHQSINPFRYKPCRFQKIISLIISHLPKTHSKIFLLPPSFFRTLFARNNA